MSAKKLKKLEAERKKAEAEAREREEQAIHAAAGEVDLDDD